MFEPIPDLPDTVVGFTAKGKIHSDDYKDTLIPAVKELIAKTGQASVIVVLGPDWEGYSGGAMFEDAKLGLEKATKWQRFALVSDADWIHHVSKLFGWIVPGEVRGFTYAELPAAKEWVSGS